MISKTLTTLMLAGALAGGVSAAAFARGGEEAQDATALANAKVSLGQAITTAEQQAGGKAFDAGVDNQNGVVRISVEVAGSQGIKTVLIDPQTGQVTNVTAGTEGKGEQAD